MVIFILSALGSIAVGVLKSGVEMVAMDYRKMLNKMFDGLQNVKIKRLGEEYIKSKRESKEK